FFFQAEDGIRDRNVTGVQTCALPILPHGRDSAAAQTGAQVAVSDGRGSRTPHSARGGAASGVAASQVQDGRFRALRVLRNMVERSEERRVGKECRSR